MKRIFSILSLTIISVVALAVPAKRIKRVITLTDGTQISATFIGDEFSHYMLSADGVKYMQQAGGRYALADEAVLARGQARRVAVNKARRTRSVQRRATWGATSNPISGSRKGLVILVNFTDKTFLSSHSQSFYDNLFNQEGYSQNNMGGSVHDYFKASSYGAFDLTFDVIGPVTVSNPYTYYGANDSDGNDKYPATMIIEACKKADALGVDFSKYDWDGNGEVDQVYIVYAGPGEAQGASENTIWPHEWELSSAKSYGDGSGAQTFDGVSVDTYACSSELAGDENSTQSDGIGTACHEFSHCMAIPDMYDTEGSNFGMDYWDLMDYGCYAGVSENGECPIGYSSYERMYCGWLTPKEISSYTEVSALKSLSQEPDAYIIYNQGNKNEYYMLENRQLEGFFKYGFGHGMLVLHVDFDAEAWANDVVNNTASRQRMTIIPADNSKGSTNTSLKGDPFPGTGNKTELTNTSTPKASTYNANTDGKKLMNMPIRKIIENTTDSTISFVAGDRIIDVPLAVDATNITDSCFTANWNAVNGAELYEISLTSRDSTTNADPAESILLTEDFSKANASADGNTDISMTLDQYMKCSGWSGSKLYMSAGNGVKMGSSSSPGKLLSPTISAPSTGKITIALTCVKYGNDNSTLDVCLNNTSTVIGTIKPSEETATTYLTADVDADFSILLITGSPKSRCYLSGLTIYDGEYTAEDLAKGTPRKTSFTNTFTTTDTSYTFTDLTPACTYSYKVRAYIGEDCSDWSNSINVNLTNPDGIEAVNGYVPGSSHSLYDLTGRLLNAIPQHGIYISNGKKILK